MRLIDADALPVKFWFGRFFGVAEIDIDNAPTIDAVEVVRCKDCRNFHKVDEVGFGRCYEHDSYGKDGDYWYMDDFCSYGERGEDAGE